MLHYFTRSLFIFSGAVCLSIISNIRGAEGSGKVAPSTTVSVLSTAQSKDFEDFHIPQDFITYFSENGYTLYKGKIKPPIGDGLSPSSYLYVCDSQGKCRIKIDVSPAPSKTMCLSVNGNCLSGFHFFEGEPRVTWKEKEYSLKELLSRPRDPVDYEDSAEPTIRFKKKDLKLTDLENGNQLHFESYTNRYLYLQRCYRVLCGDAYVNDQLISGVLIPKVKSIEGKEYWGVTSRDQSSAGSIWCCEEHVQYQLRTLEGGVATYDFPFANSSKQIPMGIRLDWLMKVNEKINNSMGRKADLPGVIPTSMAYQRMMTLAISSQFQIPAESLSYVQMRAGCLDRGDEKTMIFSLPNELSITVDEYGLIYLSYRDITSVRLVYSHSDGAFIIEDSKEKITRETNAAGELDFKVCDEAGGRFLVETINQQLQCSDLQPLNLSMNSRRDDHTPYLKACLFYEAVYGKPYVAWNRMAWLNSLSSLPQIIEKACQGCDSVIPRRLLTRIVTVLQRVCYNDSWEKKEALSLDSLIVEKIQHAFEKFWVSWLCMLECIKRLKLDSHIKDIQQIRARETIAQNALIALWNKMCPAQDQRPTLDFIKENYIKKTNETQLVVMNEAEVMEKAMVTCTWSLSCELYNLSSKWYTNQEVEWPPVNRLQDMQSSLPPLTEWQREYVSDCTSYCISELAKVSQQPELQLTQELPKKPSQVATNPIAVTVSEVPLQEKVPVGKSDREPEEKVPARAEVLQAVKGGLREPEEGTVARTGEVPVGTAKPQAVEASGEESEGEPEEEVATEPKTPKAAKAAVKVRTPKIEVTLTDTTPLSSRLPTFLQQPWLHLESPSDLWWNQLSSEQKGQVRRWNTQIQTWQEKCAEEGLDEEGCVENLTRALLISEKKIADICEDPKTESQKSRKELFQQLALKTSEEFRKCTETARLATLAPVKTVVQLLKSKHTHATLGGLDTMYKKAIEVLKTFDNPQDLMDMCKNPLLLNDTNKVIVISYCLVVVLFRLENEPFEDEKMEKALLEVVAESKDRCISACKDLKQRERVVKYMKARLHTDPNETIYSALKACD